MSPIFFGMIILKNIIETHSASVSPHSTSVGDTTHDEHISYSGSTTHKHRHTTSRYEFDATTKMQEPIDYELKKDKIIPDLSSLDRTPEHVLRVEYDKDVKVCLGNTLRAADAASIPMNITWISEDPKILFHTIIFVDLDAPTKNSSAGREWQHWVLGNIPDNRIQAGQTITDYIGPTPMHGKGTHRFVYQLFLQKHGRIHFEEKYIPARAKGKDFDRGQFSSKEFAKKYALGRPYAVNYFYVTWPEAFDEENEVPLRPPSIPPDGEFPPIPE